MPNHFNTKAQSIYLTSNSIRIYATIYFIFVVILYNGDESDIFDLPGRKIVSDDVSYVNECRSTYTYVSCPYKLHKYYAHLLGWGQSKS